MSPREFDYSAYLLGELPPEEAAAAERLLSEDPGLRERVDRLRPVVTRLEELPPEAWQGLQPPPTPPLPGAEQERARRRRLPSLTLRPLAAAAAGLALVAIGVGAGLLVAGDGPSDGQRAERGPAVQLSPPVASATGTRAAGTAVTVGEGEDRRLEVKVSELAASHAGDFYEVWLLGTGGKLVSLGSFQVPASGAATVTVPLPAEPGRYGSIDVSREPADGDPTHSKDSVLRGTAL